MFIQSVTITLINFLSRRPATFDTGLPKILKPLHKYSWRDKLLLSHILLLILHSIFDLFNLAIIYTDVLVTLLLTWLLILIGQPIVEISYLFCTSHMMQGRLYSQWVSSNNVSNFVYLVLKIMLLRVIISMLTLCCETYLILHCAIKLFTTH